MSWEGRGQSGLVKGERGQSDCLSPPLIGVKGGGGLWIKEYELWASGMPACGSLKTGSTQEGFSPRERGPQSEHLNGSQKLLADVAAAEEGHCPSPGRSRMESSSGVLEKAMETAKRVPSLLPRLREPSARWDRSSQVRTFYLSLSAALGKAWDGEGPHLQDGRKSLGMNTDCP